MSDDDLTKEKTIKDHVVKTRLFLGSRSNKMMVRQQQCLDGRRITCAPEVWQQFCTEFLAYTSIDDKQLEKTANFDSVFAGNLALLFEVILFVSEANFGKDFLSPGADTGDTSQEATPQVSE